jgi:hypothetical protein
VIKKAVSYADMINHIKLLTLDRSVYLNLTYALLRDQSCCYFLII